MDRGVSRAALFLASQGWAGGSLDVNDDGRQNAGVGLPLTGVSTHLVTAGTVPMMMAMMTIMLTPTHCGHLLSLAFFLSILDGNRSKVFHLLN